jgi:hypothetical protein
MEEMRTSGVSGRRRPAGTIQATGTVEASDSHTVQLACSVASHPSYSREKGYGNEGKRGKKNGTCLGLNEIR